MCLENGSEAQTAQIVEAFSVTYTHPKLGIIIGFIIS